MNVTTHWADRIISLPWTSITMV